MYKQKDWFDINNMGVNGLAFQESGKGVEHAHKDKEKGPNFLLGLMLVYIEVN